MFVTRTKAYIYGAMGAKVFLRRSLEWIYDLDVRKHSWLFMATISALLFYFLFLTSGLLLLISSFPFHFSSFFPLSFFLHVSTSHVVLQLCNPPLCKVGASSLAFTIFHIFWRPASFFFYLSLSLSLSPPLSLSPFFLFVFLREQVLFIKLWMSRYDFHYTYFRFN